MLISRFDGCGLLTPNLQLEATTINEKSSVQRVHAILMTTSVKTSLLFTAENVNYKPLPKTPQSCLPLKVL
jgi:hypothetical protein